MKRNNRISSLSVLLLFIISCFVLSSASIFAQDRKNMDMKNMKHEKVDKVDSAIIRKGIIDLKAIDKNKDGKVFQDQMDWNVISDKAGKCPLCKMVLSEVTLEVAKKNLLANGFKLNTK